MLSPESALIISRQRVAANLETLRRYAQLERIGLMDLQATVVIASARLDGTVREPPSAPVRKNVVHRGSGDSAMGSGALPSTP